MADYLFLLESRLSPDQQSAIRALRHICQKAAMNLYLSGGPMRDLLTGTPVRYLDFTVEGNPLELEKGLLAAGATWFHADRDERVVRLRLRGQRVRIRAARAQAQAGAEPGFHTGTIDEDLRTRGLTLNSIGLSLAEASHGLLRDPTNGQADIEARLIRMNYPYVFYDDPVFLLRAQRLQTRLQFAIEERTQARMEAARENEYLNNAKPASLGQELEAIAYEPDPAAILRALDQAGLLEAAFGKGLRAARMNLQALSELPKECENWEQLGLSVDNGLVALPLMLCKLSPAEQQKLGRLLQNSALAEQWRKIPAGAQAFEKKFIAKVGGPIEALVEVVEKTPAEAVVYASLAPSDQRTAKKLREFAARILPLRQKLPVRFLPQLGINPQSEEAQQLMQTLYRRLLRGELGPDADMVAALHALTGPPPPPPAAPKTSGGRRGGAMGREASPKPDASPAAPAPAAAPAAATPVKPSAPAAAKPTVRGRPAIPPGPAAKTAPAVPAKTAPAPGAKTAAPAGTKKPATKAKSGSAAVPSPASAAAKKPSAATPSKAAAQKPANRGSASMTRRPAQRVRTGAPRKSSAKPTRSSRSGR